MPSSDPPPPGGDQNIGSRLVILQSILISVATTLVALRLYVRAQIVRGTGLDDFFLVLALLLGWVIFTCFILAVDAGQGRHIYYLSKHQILRFSKAVHIALPIITLATACSRLSISLFLLRIVNPGRRWKYGLWALISFITINYVAMFVSAYLQCTPVEKLWNPKVPGACWSAAAQSGTNIWQGAFSIVCDFLLAILPVIFLWDVRISPRRKAGICILMGFGVVTGVCAIVRTVLTNRPITSLKDPTWDTVGSATWTALEELFLLIAAAIPAIPPLFKKSNYKRGYVPEYERPGATPLKSKPKDPYAIDRDDRFPSSVASQVSTSRPSKFSEDDSEIRSDQLYNTESKSLV